MEFPESVHLIANIKTMYMKIGILTLAMALFCLSASQAQSSRTITGKVTSSEDGSALPGVNVVLKGTSTGTVTNLAGQYSINVPAQGGALVFSFIGLQTKEVSIGKLNILDVAMNLDVTQLSEMLVTGYHREGKRERKLEAEAPASVHGNVTTPYQDSVQPIFSTEEYDGVDENIFKSAVKDPLSTFSIDVDEASYTNVRRFINNGQQPPKEAVRIEEMVNYFEYDYAQPRAEHPFNIITEISTAPWNENHKLVHIGLQGKSIATENLPPSNLVFLIDVSGSMSEVNKLPLLKSSFHMLVNELRQQDYVSIVVYAGAAGLVLEPTSGKDKQKIFAALDNLQAGGSTAGGAGIQLAYSVAEQHFKKEGNNRVILATDGDFNVGASSNESMEQLIEQKRKSGVSLTVLGFGMGNYKDSKMEILADKGNGNYAYIDNITEAKKILVNEFGGTLFTIAKDVKLQVEFNPAKVSAYRLIGYENRMLKSEDFNNDKKDAGELGSGHTVTALYEIIPVGVKSRYYNVDELKYQKTDITNGAIQSSEIMTIKFRYKEPDGEHSKLIIHPMKDKQVELANTSDNFRWSAAVAAFGMLLRESDYVNQYSYGEVVQLAKTARGEDAEGYRSEFITMVRSMDLMARK
jgi:Ca-activated chloride channel family protein